jgi:hypothetical protein
MLTDRLGGWTMRGYTKSAENTYPNMLAFLAGHKVVENNLFLTFFILV